MPTPAYTELDNNAPDGTAGTGTTFSAAALANVRALRDMAMAGRAKGFIQSRTQGTGPNANQPQFITWLNATLTLGFRMNMIWTGFDVTTIQWEWSNDNGSSWAVMGSAQVNSVTANNITTSTNSGGWVNILFEVWAKCLKVISDFNTHTLANGVAVHGLSVVSTWLANACAFTGGTLDGVTIGGTTRAAGNFTRVAEDVNLITAALNTGIVIDWSKGGSNVVTNVSGGGHNAITFSNIPASSMAGHRLYIDNLNNVTWPATVSFGVGFAPGVAPSIAGVVGITLDTVNGGTNIQASVGWQAV